MYDGQQFHISDGVNTVIFEFDDVDLGDGTFFGDGVTSGALAIPFDPTPLMAVGGVTPETANEIAIKIRDAINSSQAQAVIDIVAALADGDPAGTTNVVDLFGNATGSVDPTSDSVIPTFDFGEIGDRDIRLCQ